MQVSKRFGSMNDRRMQSFTSSAANGGNLWLGNAERNRGVALIATLVFIFILTIIVVIFLGEVEDRVQ